MKQTIIRFSGKKEKLHPKLKSWCALAGKTVNGTIIELVEKLLTENKNK